MRFEHAALDAIARSGLSTPESTVQVPRVLHYDPETNTLVMTDLTPARTLSTVLVEAFEAGTIKSVSAQIGAALGDFMGRFHKWGSEQDNARTLFLENTTSRETVLAIRYQLMIMTAEKYGMKKAWMDEMVQDGMKDANRGGSVIAMADFWFDNILVSMEPELRIYIIDWETARCARPELDVAHFATAAHSLAHVYPSADGSFVLMQHFMQSYNIHFAVDEVQIGLSAGRDVMSFGVMMPWIRHREDRVKEEIAQCGLELLECARGRDVAGVRNNVVVRDMYAGVDI
ncbi:hypothetical protein FRC06_011573 [Ceratobasidium sp. 370]|nr:hypothetical protein FRC06_011573 [Ceratobasidium sp. 370]